MPRVKMTKMTRMALYGLQLYLMVLFALILVRFFGTF
jgi:hypothetical protein